MRSKTFGPFLMLSAFIAISLACDWSPSTPSPDQSSIAPMCHMPPLYDAPANNITCPVDKPSITLVSTTCSNGIDQVIIDLPAEAQSPTGTFFSSVTGIGQSACTQFIYNGRVRVGCTGSPGDKVEIYVTLVCKASDQIKFTCPAGYQYNPNGSITGSTKSGVVFNMSNACDYIGSTPPSQTQCIGSDMYNPALHCCDIPVADNTVGLGRACPDGYGVANLDYGGLYKDNVCTKQTYEGMFNGFEYILPACATPTKPKNTCKPKTCGPSYQWNPDTCSCEYVPG